MAYILPKTDYVDGEVLFGNDLNASNAVIKAGVDDNFDRILDLDAEKQDLLTADVDYLTPSTASETYEVKKGVDDFYVTNDEKLKLENTSGTNTGDETKSTVETKLGAASAVNNGYLSTGDFTTLTNKQDELVSGESIKTINGESVLGAGNIVLATEIPIASDTVLGGIKIGTGLTIEVDGTVNAAGGSGTGDVVGPISSTDNDIALFNGTTGNIIKDSGTTLASLETVTNKVTTLDASKTDTQYPGAKTVYDSLLLKENNLPDTPSTPETMFLNGNKQWSQITIGSGGYASNIYMNAATSDLVPTYKMSSAINDVAEATISTTCNNNEVLARTYLYNLPLLTDTIDAGSWVFNLYSAIDAAAADSQFKVEVFARESSGTETVLFSAYSPTIENRVGYEGYKYNMIETIQPSFTISPTARLGHRIYVKTNAAGDRTLSYKIGDGSASYLNTPLALRHSQLRDKNGEELYQHIDAIDREIIDSAITSPYSTVYEITACTKAEYDALSESSKRYKIFNITDDYGTIINVIDNLTTVGGANALNANQGNILAKNIGNSVDTYSASSTYALGSLVIYNNLLYKCTTAITVAEAWTIGHWTQVSLTSLAQAGDVYSTSEVKTNKVWIDGKPIYRKVITGVHSDGETLLSNVDTLVSICGQGDNITGIIRALPWVEIFSEKNYTITVQILSNNIKLSSLAGNVSQPTSASTKITLEYTKTS